MKKNVTNFLNEIFAEQNPEYIQFHTLTGFNLLFGNITSSEAQNYLPINISGFLNTKSIMFLDSKKFSFKIDADTKIVCEIDHPNHYDWGEYITTIQVAIEISGVSICVYEASYGLSPNFKTKNLNKEEYYDEALKQNQIVSFVSCFKKCIGFLESINWKEKGFLSEDHNTIIIKTGNVYNFNSSSFGKIQNLYNDFYKLFLKNGNLFINKFFKDFYLKAGDFVSEKKTTINDLNINKIVFSEEFPTNDFFDTKLNLEKIVVDKNILDNSKSFYQKNKMLYLWVEDKKDEEIIAFNEALNILKNQFCAIRFDDNEKTGFVLTNRKALFFIEKEKELSSFVKSNNISMTEKVFIENLVGESTGYTKWFKRKWED